MARILLVEPDKTLAKIYAAALEKAGHELEVCSGAQQAITIADSFSPEIVILELQLARHNGVEFLFEFRSYAEWANTPVIILSHVPRATGTENLGVSTYLYKPQTKLKDLVLAVDSILTPAK